MLHFWSAASPDSLPPAREYHRPAAAAVAKQWPCQPWRAADLVPQGCCWEGTWKIMPGTQMGRIFP